MNKHYRQLYQICLAILSLLILLLSGCNNEQQWNLQKMNVYESWNISKGQSQTIAFIDTGIAPNLMEIYKERVVHPYNAIEDSFDVSDKNGHGTEMISAACGAGTMGVWGVAPEARIMPILAANENGFASPDALVKGIDWAIAHDASIINLSLGNVVPNNQVLNRIQLAIQQNIIVIAATGDYGDPNLLFPASEPDVISVGAQDQTGNLIPISNYSEKMSIIAPGKHIPVVSLNGDVMIRKEVSGTSVSTAIISGLICLALDVKRPLTKNTLVNAMKNAQNESHFINSMVFLHNISGGI